mmetsp:Transcript_12719/g.36518  ORF Transcript_12719/g.36518 Transcript_12719/m.36518 type:complete len:203 (+) Transcript_12719:163-771(+)
MLEQTPRTAQLKYGECTAAPGACSACGPDREPGEAPQACERRIKRVPGQAREAEREWKAPNLATASSATSTSARKPACGWASTQKMSKSLPLSVQAARRACSAYTRHRTECVGTIASSDSRTSRLSQSWRSCMSSCDSSQKKFRQTKLHTKSSVSTKYLIAISMAFIFVSWRTCCSSWPSTRTFSSKKQTGSKNVSLSTCGF